MVHHNTTFDYKQLSDLEDIFWTNPGHTDRQTDRRTRRHGDSTAQTGSLVGLSAAALAYSSLSLWLHCTRPLPACPPSTGGGGGGGGCRPTTRHRLLAVDRFLYSAVLRSRADSLSRVVLNEWLLLFVARFDNHQSGQLKRSLVVAWLMPRETAVARSGSVLFTPYSHALQRHVTSCKATYIGCVLV